jgi:pyruvate kinase
MIARGDLAVEAGNERTAELQEEILWACEAAHLPVVWATQVLEDLAKTGRPSRAEVTDAAMATRAESVMLNRGPYVDRAVWALDDILRRTEAHQRTKVSLLRRLRSWSPERS